MEKDKEIKGDGNSYTTEFRQYDPRLGRWLSLDPLMMMFPSMSPYVAFDNNPIFYNDPLGLASESTNGGGDKDKVTVSQKQTNKDAANVNGKPKKGWLNLVNKLFPGLYKNEKFQAVFGPAKVLPECIITAHKTAKKAVAHEVAHGLSNIMEQADDAMRRNKAGLFLESLFANWHFSIMIDGGTGENLGSNRKVNGKGKIIDLTVLSTLEARIGGFGKNPIQKTEKLKTGEGYLKRANKFENNFNKQNELGNKIGEALIPEYKPSLSKSSSKSIELQLQVNDMRSEPWTSVPTVEHYKSVKQMKKARPDADSTGNNGKWYATEYKKP